MPTLYVENVPVDLYEALRRRASQRRKSISAEVLDLLEQNVPTPKELSRRRKVLKQVLLIRAQPAPQSGPFPTVEELLREDRRR